MPPAKFCPAGPSAKSSRTGWRSFYAAPRGSWFRVKDLAQAFDIDRKTAWEYLQKFQDAGLLVHNRGRSAAVRYRLADDFLKVQDGGRAAAGGPSPGRFAPASSGAGDRMAGGHRRGAFLGGRLAAPDGSRPPEEIVGSLKAAQVLETLLQSGQNQLLRLQRRWLRSPEE